MMETQSQIEAALCDALSGFGREYLGRKPDAIHAYLRKDLLVVRLQGVLNVAERQLLNTAEPGKGRDLLKQIRTALIETARPIMTLLVEAIIGVKVLSLHHDISTVTGEEIIIFTLAEVPPSQISRR